MTLKKFETILVFMCLGHVCKMVLRCVSFFVVTLRNLIPMFEWCMARFEMKDRETKKTYVMARLNYVLKM